jgi:hypothetical protein
MSKGGHNIFALVMKFLRVDFSLYLQKAQYSLSTGPDQFGFEILI